MSKVRGLNPDYRARIDALLSQTTQNTGEIDPIQAITKQTKKTK
jgi:hypothetical protein